MDLQTVRLKLERLEDTICLLLFERMQFKLNKIIYQRNSILVPGSDESYFESLFRKLERVYDSVGRYAYPEERPFFVVPTKPVIQPLDDIGIKPVTNLTAEILSAYMKYIPRLCDEGDDNQRGSPSTADINCLQALSRRVHIGEQVAEVKYQTDKAAYDALIRTGDREGIIQRLRDVAVEERNLARILAKSERYHVPGEIVCSFFRDVVMPLTIKVEVDYFMHRGEKQ